MSEVSTPPATPGGEPNPALVRQPLTRPNVFVILYQAYKDFVGKDVQQTTTYSYVWSADQAGHIMLGFVPTFLVHWLAAWLATGVSVFGHTLAHFTPSLFGYTFHEPAEILNCALLVMSAWTALETWDFIDSSLKIARSSGYFQGNYLELFWNVVTALFYFGVGAGIAGSSYKENGYAFRIFLWLLVPGLAVAYLWLRTKILFQRAGLPFLYRLPNYDGVLDFYKPEADAVPAPLAADVQATVARKSTELAEQFIAQAGADARTKQNRRAIRAYVERKVRATAGGVVRQAVGRAADLIRAHGPAPVEPGGAEANDALAAESFGAYALGLTKATGGGAVESAAVAWHLRAAARAVQAEAEQAAEQAAGQSAGWMATYLADKKKAITFINAMRAAPPDPRHTYMPGADAAVPRRHLIVAGPQNSGKTSLAVGIGTEFAFRFPSGGIGRYTTMSELVQIVDARTAQNANAGPAPPAGATEAAATPAGSAYNAPESSRLISADPINSEFNDGRVLWKWASVDLLIVDDVIELLLPVRRAVEERIRGDGFRASVESLVADHTDLSRHMLGGEAGVKRFFDEHLERIREQLSGLASPEKIGQYVAESYAEVIAAIRRIPRVVWVLGDMIRPELFEDFVRQNFEFKPADEHLLTVRLLPPEPPPPPSWWGRNWTALKNWLSKL